jgi:DNA-binding HxlR family transcriptional regulator
MKTRSEITCPLELTHDITKGKWKPIILWQLGKTVCSLSKLKNGIKGISQKILLEQLKELQEFDLIGKNEFSGYPLKVEYYIKDRGKKMLEAIKIMQEIGIEIMQENGM